MTWAACAAVMAATAATPAGAVERPATPAGVEALLSSGRQAIAGGVSGVLDAAGIQPVPNPPVIADGHVTEAIATLSAAVRQASATVRSAVPADTTTVAALRQQMRRAPRGLAGPPDWFDASTAAALDQAAASVAAAVDAAMPALSSARAIGPIGEVVEGCDLLDQAPAVCVAGAGDNVIVQDYALVVDLGGADRHAHAAGGADLFGNDLPVSVTIDVDGADVYDYAAPGLDEPGATVAQGSALVGVGILVDAAGDDIYRITGEGALASAFGQGTGQHGVGILVDSVGDDSYTLAASGPGYVTALGQGDGANGVGALLDGGGDDAYVVRAIATDYLEWMPGYFLPPSPAAIGIGVGRLGMASIQTPYPVHVDAAFINPGYGLFGDAGGTDQLSIEALAPHPGRDLPVAQLHSTPAALVAGIGAGYTQGTGLAILGGGDTTVTVRGSSAIDGAVVQADGMGIADNNGRGVLADAGGNDQRILAGDVTVARHAGSDACAGCAAAATATADTALVRGMGYGHYSGVGLLRDGAGHDRYEATAASAADASVDMGDGGAEPGAATATAGSVWVAVQGAAEESGWGELADAAGDDVYTADATSQALAASSNGAAATGVTTSPSASTATAGDAVVLAQAAGRTLGAGHLFDRGGSDRYLASGSASATTEGQASGAAGQASPGVLASVDGLSRATFLDADDGADDIHAASPAAEACTGTRGRGTWVDCGGAGAGAMT